MLQNAYEREEMSQATVFCWWKHFKAGNKRAIDNTQSRRPSTTVTDVIIVKGIVWHFKCVIGKYSSYYYSAAMSQMCTRWVPCDLNDGQKIKNVEVCQ
jgi:hypothetical protein